MMSLRCQYWGGEERGGMGVRCFFFPKPVFLSVQMEKCLPPALSPCKTNTTESQAFARGLWFSCCHHLSNNSYLAEFTPNVIGVRQTQ